MAEPARRQNPGRATPSSGRSTRGKHAAGKRSSARRSKRPAAKRPAAKRPAAKRPAAKRPAAKRPAAKRPASRRGKPSFGRRLRRRLTPKAGVGGMLAILLLLGVMASGPYADYTAARGRVETLSGDQAQLLEAVEALETERARLEDPAALEEEARSELGLSRPGEIPYIVVNPPTPEPVPAPEPEPTEEPSLIDRVVGVVTGWLE